METKKCWNCDHIIESDDWSRDETGWAFDVCPNCGATGDYINDTYDWESNRRAVIKHKDCNNRINKNKEKIDELNKINLNLEELMKKIEDGIWRN